MPDHIFSRNRATDGTEIDGEKMLKRIARLAIVMTVPNGVSAFGQSRAEIEAQFGQPVNAFSVSETIWMSSEYASDGQVCRMVFLSKAVFFHHNLPGE